MLGPAERRALALVLEESRARGFLGPGPLEVHVDQALAMVSCVATPPRRFLDLGTGGGVPGLVLALAWAHSRAVLLDASVRRLAFVRWAVTQLDLEARCEVVAARAEDAAWTDALRGRLDLVVARGFGAPALVAECAVGLLRVGGQLVVTEPRDGRPEARWPPEPVAGLGYALPRWCEHDGYPFVVLTKVESTGSWPRQGSALRRRPLWA